MDDNFAPLPISIYLRNSFRSEHVDIEGNRVNLTQYGHGWGNDDKIVKSYLYAESARSKGCLIDNLEIIVLDSVIYFHQKRYVHQESCQGKSTVPVITPI